jgi:hypothetical protein
LTTTATTGSTTNTTFSSTFAANHDPAEMTNPNWNELSEEDLKMEELPAPDTPAGSKEAFMKLV